MFKHEDIIAYLAKQLGWKVSDITKLTTQEVVDILLRHWKHLNQHDKGFTASLIAGGE